MFPGPNQPDAFTDVNKCVNFSGAEIKAIANGLDPQVEVVVSAHTHQPYICTIAGKLVTSAASFGRLITDIDLTHRPPDEADRRGEGRRTVIVTQDVAKDPAETAIIDKYTTLSAPLANRVVGSHHRGHPLGRDTPRDERRR